MSKDDFLKECMRDVGAAAIDEFQRNICVRCINASCARSGSNNMLFNLRAQNWKRDLFDEVPRLNEDESHSIMRSRSKFISVNEPKCSEVATPQNETQAEDSFESTKEPSINELVKEPIVRPVQVTNPGVYNTPTQSKFIQQPTNPQNSSRETDENTIVFDDE